MSRSLNAPGDVALVVLGAAVWEGGMPSPTLRRRTRHAAMLFNAGHAGLIVCSGGVGRYPPAEAEVMRRLLVAEGVPATAISLEDQSHSTLENVLFSARVLRARGVGRVIVVSDKYHLPRAVMCFRALNFETTGSGPNRADSGTPLRKWLYYYLREFAALPWYLTKLGTLRHRFAEGQGQP